MLIREGSDEGGELGQIKSQATEYVQKEGKRSRIVTLRAREKVKSWHC